MTTTEAREAIISEIKTINFCGHCLCMECKTCKKDKARKEALRNLQKTYEKKPGFLQKVFGAKKGR